MDFVTRKCKDCGQTYELHPRYTKTLYADYCASCFFDNVVEDIYGALRLKTQEEKIKDDSYKDELIGVSHRGKIRV